MILDPFWNFITLDIGMDLGTANTLIFVRGHGIVLREPTVVAQHRKTKQVVAVGQPAKEMVGKTPENIKTVQPIANGVIADFEAAQALIRDMLKRVHQTPQLRGLRLPHPRVVIGVPALVTEVERRAVVDAARQAGARSVYLVDESMASALGSGLLTGEAKGKLLVDIGGGTTEIAVVSLNGLVVNRSVPVAGWEMDQAIITYARDHYQLLIGGQTAEQIKIDLGLGWPDDGATDRTMTLRGRDLVSGLPKAVKISAAEIHQALLPILDQLRLLVEELLEETPPELSADINKFGLTLAGGGALLAGIDQYFAHHLDMPVVKADQPLSAVVDGTARLLDQPDLLKRLDLTPDRKPA